MSPTAPKTSQPYDRIYNFSAGPGTLPVEVLEQARDEMLNYRGLGMSVMEMSHRGKVFEGILAEAQEDIRKLMDIPANYKILFLQGGASLQFSMIPMNFLPAGKTASYITTGTWGQKAIESASLIGQVHKAFDAKETNYDRVPDFSSLSIPPDAAYVHFTSNETIQGVDFLADPSLPGTVFCDMSSNILSRPVDVSKYVLIYAGAQKNMGPAGVTLVILREDLLDRVPSGLGPMLDYKVQVENDSLYNTPPCWSIYVCGLVYKHLLKLGGLSTIGKQNEEKAGLIYGAIDGSGGFYKAHAQSNCRSRMNIAFTLPSEELTETFLKEAKAQGFDGLKGHRSVGGCRASVYNAFPREGCAALAAFMREFASRNG